MSKLQMGEPTFLIALDAMPAPARAPSKAPVVFDHDTHRISGAPRGERKFRLSPAVDAVSERGASKMQSSLQEVKLNAYRQNVFRMQREGNITSSMAYSLIRQYESQDGIAQDEQRVTPIFYDAATFPHAGRLK